MENPLPGMTPTLTRSLSRPSNRPALPHNVSSTPRRRRVRRLRPCSARLHVKLSGATSWRAASGPGPHRLPVAEDARPALVAVFEAFFHSPMTGMYQSRPSWRQHLVGPKS